MINWSRLWIFNEKALDRRIDIVYTMFNMKKEVKEKVIAIRVTEEEKEQVEQAAKDNGFHSVSQFLIWLVKKYGKKS